MPELPDPTSGALINAVTWGEPVNRRIISRYADSSTRDSDNPSPEQGDPAYLEDDDIVQFYDGSDWWDAVEAPEIGDDGFEVKWVRNGYIVTLWWKLLVNTAGNKAYNFPQANGTMSAIPAAMRPTVESLLIPCSVWTYPNPGSSNQPDDIVWANLRTDGFIYCYNSSGVTSAGVAGLLNDIFFGHATYDVRIT